MRDATDYYNLLNDTLKNGRNQIKYIYDKIDNAIEKGKYINIRTGCLIKEKDFNNYNYYFHDDTEYPLCYKFPCCGLARDRVIKKIMNFYIRCLREYHKTKDEEKMKQLIENEIETAKNNYEYLNKNNKGFDDLKLFNIPPHINEPQESEDSINSSSFINDNNSSSNNEDNSFINDDEIKENEEEKSIKKKPKLIKNGKKVVNIYKKELDDLLEENYDGEEELKNEENEEKEENEENEFDYGLDLNTKYSSFKKKKLCKKNLLNKKLKRNVINDSDEENEEESEKDENKNEENINEENASEKQNLSQEMKNLLKREEEEEEEVDREGSNNNIINNIEIQNKKKKEPINYEYYKGLKENLKLRQGTLDAFLNIKK